MKKRLRDLVPPWADGKVHLALCLTVLGLVTFYSIYAFCYQYDMARDMLYVYNSTPRILEPGAKMKYFVDLINSHGYVSNFFSYAVFFPFVFPILGAICLAVYNYMSFRNGSSSHYLMRRLPDKWEYHRRCLALPLLTILASLVLIPVLLGLYYAIYILFTPEQCLQPDQWERFREYAPYLFIPNFNKGWG